MHVIPQRGDPLGHVVSAGPNLVDLELLGDDDADSVPVASGAVAFEVAERLTQLARDCMGTLRRLGYPDAREVPTDPDAERAYRESC